MQYENISQLTDMRKFIIIGAVLLMGITASAQEKFSNPVISPNWADPTVWRSDGHFYSLATSLAEVKVSDDLVSWETAGDPLSEQTREMLAGLGKWLWAPDIIKIGERWMLYITCYNSLEDNRIVCLSSDSPTGPWAFESIVTDSRETGIKDTIDAEVVLDPKTGKLWLFFGSTGKVHHVQLDASGTKLAPKAKYEHVAGVDKKDNPSRDKVFEGTYLYRHDGWWYLFGSVGLYKDETYRLVCGRSRTLTGKFRNRKGRPLAEGEWTPVISSENGDRFYGPGHNGEIFTDSLGQDYIIYHSHDATLEKAGWRPALLQRIFWDKKGWPYVENGKPAETEITPTFQ